MEIVLDEKSNIATVYTVVDGRKRRKDITVDDLIKSLISSVNRGTEEIYTSPLFAQVKGTSLIQSKSTSGGKKCLYIIHKKKHRTSMSLYERFYDNVGVPGLLFAVHSVNDKLVQLDVVAVKDEVISENTRIYMYPFTNVTLSVGRACLGMNTLNKGLIKKKSLFDVPDQFMSMPNTIEAFSPNKNSKGYILQELLKELINKDFDDELLVENKTIHTYKEWFKEINI